MDCSSEDSKARIDPAWIFPTVWLLHPFVADTLSYERYTLFAYRVVPKVTTLGTGASVGNASPVDQQNPCVDLYVTYPNSKLACLHWNTGTHIARNGRRNCPVHELHITSEPMYLQNHIKSNINYTWKLLLNVYPYIYFINYT
jgi:hypothetical protein